MKKRKLIALLVVLALAVLVALVVAVPRLLQNTPNAKLLRAVQQAEADADAGDAYDLSDAEALLMAMEPEKAAASLEKLSAKVEKAGDTPVVACLLEARLAQAGKLPDVDVTALARRALELPWKSYHLAELPGVLAPLPQEELLAILAAETDAERRLAVARVYGSALTEPDAVLAYIAEAREVGLSAVDCYPEGAAVTWDLSGLDRYGWAWGISGVSPKYLVVSLTEAEEAFEYRFLPSGTPEDCWDYEGSFTMDYESNNGRWAETTTVRIDTAALDATPEAYRPSTVREASALVVLDTYYEARNVLRLRTDVTRSRTGGTSTANTKDYRTYRLVQRMDVYNKRGTLVHHFDVQVTEPELLEKDSDGTLAYRRQGELKFVCVPSLDDSWMQERRSWLLEQLEACQGDLWRVIQVND